MCNRYHSTPRDRLPALFGGTTLTDAPYEPVIAPLRLGPYLKPCGHWEVGQWGMIPPRSATRTPTTSQGRRMSTNNARRETVATAWTFAGAWKAGRRCLIPALSYDEPYYPDDVKNVWWRFQRADGQPWALAGLWSEWTDPATGEVVPNYTMLTQNCDGHPLLARFHKPERDPATKQILPPERQDKRSVVPIEPADWDAWLHGTAAQAEALIRLPVAELFRHGPADGRPGADLLA